MARKFTGPTIPAGGTTHMLHKLRQRAQDEKGFTLIELLVVILIIGILAAIALPAFLNQRGKAQDTEAKSAARTAQTAMETWYTDEQDYSGDEAALRAIEPALNEGVAGTDLVVTPGAADVATDGYAVEVTSETGNVFTITKEDAAAGSGVERTCTDVSTYGCNSDGEW
jgi:type IV pilus assembly protein PilA